jgi:probable phosphoglycerate mutase
MITTVLLIRHGETDWNADRRWQGHLDIPLNEEGKQQGRALAKRLKDLPIRALYCSDLQRASLTAEILAEQLGVRPVYEPAWRERDVGAFSGLTSDEVRDKYPHVWAEMQQGILNPPDGENHKQFYARAGAAFEQLLQRHTGECVAVVSHGGTIANVVAYVLEIGPGSYGRLALRGNTGLSIIEAGPKGRRVTLLNDTCHLAELR